MINDSRVSTSNRTIILWLSLCALLVAAMVLIGGYTRLSGSGLSITTWKPIHGVMPPMSVQEWQEEFSAYQQSPQYKKVNMGMTLDEFKVIFWPEFIHRLLGRVIGVVFFIPLLIFAAQKKIHTRLGWRLFGIFLLGGLQGVIGWLMVASGLIDDPNVSHIRLALHLSTAFAILALILWTILELMAGINLSSFFPNKAHKPIKSLVYWFALLCLQIVLGAFMAGLHAGLIYNTWPTMDGQFAPPELFFMKPWYLNFFHNLTMIQFMHRNTALLVAFSFLLWWNSHREYVKNAHLGKVCAVVALMIALQFTLGVLTLVKAVPLPLAMMHQMTALALFAASVVLLHKVHGD